MEIGYARNVTFIQKLPNGVDLDRKSYKDYPHEMVKAPSFEEIEDALGEALINFKSKCYCLI